MKGVSDAEFEGGSAIMLTKEEMVAVNEEVKSQVRTQYNSFGADFLLSRHDNLHEKGITKIINILSSSLTLKGKELDTISSPHIDVMVGNAIKEGDNKGKMLCTEEHSLY